MAELKPISEAFAGIEEPRHKRNLKYPLVDVITLAIYGSLCGHTDFTSMAYFLKKREATLTGLFGLTAGVPSHDVFSDVFRLIDVQKFLACYLDWLSSVLSELTGEHLAIDGKALVAATKKSSGGKIPYILNAYAIGMGITVCQLEVGEKDNEITYIPKLLDLFDIEGCTVTIDAIGTQTKIMDLIHERGGHFCLQLKRNHRKAFEAVGLFFEGKGRELEEGAGDTGLDVLEETCHGHGREETRAYLTFALRDDDRPELPEGWGHVRAIGMAVLVRDVVGRPSKWSAESHYHVLSREMPAAEYAGYARGHWGIENGLHHVLDVHLGEDGSTAREGNAKSNLALLRKISLNVSRQVMEREGGRRKTRKEVAIDFTLEPELFVEFLFGSVPLGVSDGSVSV